MAASPVDRIQGPHMATLDITTSKNLNLYNKKQFALPEKDRYDLTTSKCTDLYKELENVLFIFGFEEAFMIVTSRYPKNHPVNSRT